MAGSGVDAPPRRTVTSPGPASDGNALNWSESVRKSSQRGSESHQPGAVRPEKTGWTEVSRGRFERLVAHVRRYYQRARAGNSSFRNESRSQAVRAVLPRIDARAGDGALDDLADSIATQRIDVCATGIVLAGEQRTATATAFCHPGLQRAHRAGRLAPAERHGHYAPGAPLPVLLLPPDEQQHALSAEGDILHTQGRQIGPPD